MPIRIAKIALACIAALFIPTLTGTAGEVADGLSLFVLIAILWLTEALHVSATAMLVPVACVALGILDTGAALAGFAHPVIYLFFGGFALAAALQVHGIDRRIALGVIRFAGGRIFPAMLLIFAVTALLSMWISNTATTAMILPLALGLVSGVDPKRHASLYAFLLLGVAWSANIGGIGTLVGSPPNAIVAANLGLGFRDWLVVGLPAMLVLLPVAIVMLWILLRPMAPEERIDDTGMAAAPTLGPGGIATLTIFLTTVAAWIFSAPLGNLLGIEKNFDTVVALSALLALVITGAAQWQDIESRVNWGVLILFGGGITLSTALSQTGASDYLGSTVKAMLAGEHPLILLLIVTAFVVFLTELVSNTTSAALLVPMFAGVATSLGMPEQTLAFAIGISASCAFMLPVATPPNALVFGTGWLEQRTMMRNGLFMNLACVILITLLVYGLT